MSPERDGRPVEIMLVEDNPGDTRLILEVLKEGRARNRLYVLENGDDAMAFLRKERCYANASRPDIILLDLNLPGKDGREVLAEIKQDHSLKRIPVVVLTTSGAEQDVMSAYHSHANCYITKPTNLSEFVAVVRAIEGFWFDTVRLPKE